MSRDPLAPAVEELKKIVALMPMDTEEQRGEVLEKIDGMIAGLSAGIAALKARVLQGEAGGPPVLPQDGTVVTELLPAKSSSGVISGSGKGLRQRQGNRVPLLMNILEAQGLKRGTDYTVIEGSLSRSRTMRTEPYLLFSFCGRASGQLLVTNEGGTYYSDTIRDPREYAACKDDLVSRGKMDLIVFDSLEQWRLTILYLLGIGLYQRRAAETKYLMSQLLRAARAYRMAEQKPPIVHPEDMAMGDVRWHGRRHREDQATMKYPVSSKELNVDQFFLIAGRGFGIADRYTEAEANSRVIFEELKTILGGKRIHPVRDSLYYTPARLRLDLDAYARHLGVADGAELEANKMLEVRSRISNREVVLGRNYLWDAATACGWNEPGATLGPALFLRRLQEKAGYAMRPKMDRAYFMHFREHLEPDLDAYASAAGMSVMDLTVNRMKMLAVRCKNGEEVKGLTYIHRAGIAFGYPGGNDMSKTAVLRSLKSLYVKKDMVQPPDELVTMVEAAYAETTPALKTADPRYEE